MVVSAIFLLDLTSVEGVTGLPMPTTASVALTAEAFSDGLLSLILSCFGEMEFLKLGRGDPLAAFKLPLPCMLR